MKIIRKIFLATVIAFFINGLTWTSPAEAYRGGHYRGNYRGNFRSGQKSYYKRGIKRYGHGRQLQYGKHYYKHRFRHKPRYSHRGRLGPYRYSLGIHLGHGYHSFYRYPYPSGYG